jgi:hypothetical protein
MNESLLPQEKTHKKSEKIGKILTKWAYNAAQ